ncbi:MAG: DUF72 domain-containing protein [Candidatus Caldarchaeum sp.]|nr:DUF72 domain-containing protein [Candidatus Caldarchaeum sp.]MDW8434736.1 DUF72 domain-containing protein [Candidatus Caldarchaeum sp.]
MGVVLLGTSGWSYEEWTGPVYGGSRLPKLRLYSKIFRTAEMDSSFYVYPRREALTAMMDSVPEGFVFTVKAPQEITHQHRLETTPDALRALEKFTELLTPMNRAGMLGCILFQLPPSLSYEPAKLETFLENLDKDFRYAVEFRHPSWLNEETQHILAKNQTAYTIVDEPLLPPLLWVTTDFAYVRWHGRGKQPWYNYLYKPEELREWVPRITEISQKTEKVYGYFNNHFHGYAVYNCIQILEMMGLSTETHQSIKQQIQNYFEMTGLG